ncbi:MAG: aminopeptidase P family protein [Candidatus Omnitrophica bacterium]|nr:aminopeptidase P family protein [Candidatus Omnitrophota bacterium]
MLSSYQLDGYIHSNDVNIRYLTYFPASESLLLSFPTKSLYLTDSRYLEEARDGLDGVKVEQFTHNIFHSVFNIMVQNKVKRLGFDEHHFSVYQFKQLQKACPRDIQLVCANDIVEKMREIKDAVEITQIRKCLDLNLSAYKYLQGVIRWGMTEQDVLIKLERYVRSKGADFSFDPIIASGPNSAFPHARISRRKIRNNEPVLVDMGIDIDGYKSDLTRMFFLGKMPALYQRIYAAVSCAQNHAIAKIQAGVKAADIDFAARNYLESLGLAKYFGHSLGHGVGLDIHELPRLSSQSGAILQEGMVVTVEPGVYLPGQFGIRLEEMVLVKRRGYEVLSRKDKVKHS